jgi:hypothetical protein
LTEFFDRLFDPRFDRKDNQGPELPEVVAVHTVWALLGWLPRDGTPTGHERGDFKRPLFYVFP